MNALFDFSPLCVFKCMCLAFLHCVCFKCICLTFLHCVFLNACVWSRFLATSRFSFGCDQVSVWKSGEMEELQICGKKFFRTCRTYVSSDGRVANLWQKVFPHVPYIRLFRWKSCTFVARSFSACAAPQIVQSAVHTDSSNCIVPVIDLTQIEWDK